jgi:predicted dienelactone hydrolase
MIRSGPTRRSSSWPRTRAAAARRAVAAASYPLVIVSHGYPGSRLQMSYLTENLASKGYVVVAIDHLESTRADKAGFPARC